jgi:hypothetical protein
VGRLGLSAGGVDQVVTDGGAGAALVEGADHRALGFDSGRTRQHQMLVSMNRREAAQA